MEEMDDDDFGDLYADVEALVSSVINNGGGGGGGGGGNYAAAVATEKCDMDEGYVPGSVGEDGKISGLEVSGGEEEKLSLEDDDDDSEDDLNIVLNEDDFTPVAFPGNGGVRNGGGSEGGGGNGNGNGNEKGDDFAGVNNGTGSDNKNHSDGLVQSAEKIGADRRIGRKGSRPSAQILQYKYITRRARTRTFRSTVKGNRFSGARGDWKNTQWNGDKFSGSSQVARFQLQRKRTRTILNANIDKFEQKPWRSSGVDVTDFFNFGFNEQSWKDYCSSVQKLQQQASMQSRVHDYFKYYEACDAGLEYEEMSEEAMANETAQDRGGIDNPDSASEFTIGVRHLELPKGRRIQVEGSNGERQSSMDVKHPLGLDPDVVIQITGQDTRENYTGSEKKDLDHKHSALHEASENEEFGTDATCSPRSAGGDKPSTESLERGIRTSDRHAAALRRCSQQGASYNPTSVDSDLEWKRHKKLQFSEGNAEAMEARSNEKEEVRRNLRRKDPSMMETESSYGGQVQLSPSLSGFGSQSEASEDDVYPGLREVQRPLRRPSLNPVAELRESNEPGYNLSRDSDSNNVRGKPGYLKESARINNSPGRERRTLFSNRPHGEADGGGAESPTSDKEVLYATDHSHVIRGRQHERLHGFDSYHKDDTSFYREKYHGERFANDHFRNANSRRPYLKHHPRYKNETGPFFKRKCGERGFHDRRITMGRDWHHRERGVAFKDMDCPMHRNRKWVSKFSFHTHKGNPRWGRRNDEHFFKKRNGGDWLECGHADNFMQGKNRRAVPFADRECDCSDERCSRYAGSRMKNFGRGERYDDTPTSDINYSRFRGTKYNFRRHVDRHPSSSRFYKETHTTDGEKWPGTVSPGDDVDDLRLTDGHGIPRRGMFAERCRDGDRFDSYNDADDAENGVTSPRHQVQSGRSGQYKQSKAFHLADDELFSSHKDDKFYDEEASFSNKKISRHEQIHATNRSSHGRITMDEKQTEQHRYEMIRERNGGHFFNTSSMPNNSVKHEQRVHPCGDSVGERKSYERSTEAENAACNDKLEDKSSERDEEYTPSMVFNEFQIEKGEIVRNQEIDEWLDKFPVLEDNEALDLEEGQIITDELDMDFLMEENDALENAAPAGNVRERMFDNENAATMNEVFEGIDQDRILESIAKMEKRRERFKEPLMLRKEPDKNGETQGDQEIETAETNQQRPNRKRLWGGSYAPHHIGNSEHQVFFDET